MRISTKDIQVGDLVRFADWNKGEVINIHRVGAMSQWYITVKDEVGRIGHRRVNDAGSVEKIDTLETPNPFGPRK